jgi:hypothetical protein
MAKKVVVATHGHCFDGMASAALFVHLLRAIRGPGAPEPRFKSCGYGPGMSMIPEEWLDGDENAILDFRYTPSARLGFYFDHHVTAFGSPEERDLALARALPPGAPGEGPHVFYEPTYSSCTKLIADVSRDAWGVDVSGLEELVRWADLIDSARFSSAEAAVDRTEPVLQLASVIEHHGDTAFLGTVVPELLEKGLDGLARSPGIQEAWRPLAAAHDAFKLRVARRARTIGRAVLVDLTDAPLDVGAKFVTYALYPQAVYSVMLTRARQHYKLSIGYNPWCGAPREHDVASICKRYGGGGHPAVGAASFPLSALERARQCAEAVARELA